MDRPHEAINDEAHARSARGHGDALRAHQTRLGEALGEHAGEVLERVSHRSGHGCPQLATSARSILARVCVLSTCALARWIAGESTQRSLAPGAEALALLQDLAMRESAAIADVEPRWEHWRAAVLEVLAERAAMLATPPEVLAKASSMASTAFAVNLASTHEIFGGRRVALRAADAPPQRRLPREPVRSRAGRPARSASALSAARR